MTNVVSPCTKAEAKTLTDRIRNGVDQLWSLLLEAHERKAWKALGYGTWAAYVKAEFDMSRQNSYLILDQGRAAQAIEEATGVKHAGQITQRDAEAVKDDLPAVKGAIRARVEAGEEPEGAVAEVIAESRRVKAEQKAERERRQADNDRTRAETAAQFSPAVQEHRARSEEYRSQSKAQKSKPAPDTDAMKAEIEEKAEYIASLEAENADLKRQIAKFDDMAVQYEQGGFEKVIAGKDEEIRVLETRLYSTNADMISWKKKAAWEAKEKLRFKGEAESRGYSDDGDQANSDNGEAVDERTVF